MGDTLNCRQECYPVRRGENEKTTMRGGGEREEEGD